MDTAVSGSHTSGKVMMSMLPRRNGFVEMTAAEARELAALLVQSAEIAEETTR
jgi:hypothetical protein